MAPVVLLSTDLSASGRRRGVGLRYRVGLGIITRYCHVPSGALKDFMSYLEQLHPLCGDNQTLQAHVHPTDWVNPTPSGRYNLVVVDRVVGATIVAAHAGDLIGEVTLAIKNRIGLGKIASVIHPYPTQAEAIRKLGDQYNRTRLTPMIKTAFEKWLAWTR